MLLMMMPLPAEAAGSAVLCKYVFPAVLLIVMIGISTAADSSWESESSAGDEEWLYVSAPRGNAWRTIGAGIETADAGADEPQVVNEVNTNNGGDLKAQVLYLSDRVEHLGQCLLESENKALEYKHETKIHIGAKRDLSKEIVGLKRQLEAADRELARFFSVPASSLVEGGLALWQQRFFARVWFWRSGWSQLAVPARVFVEMQADGRAQRPDGQGGAAASFTAEQADRLVRERLNQAFSSVFGKLIESSERAAAAAEKQANVVKSDNLVKGLKCDQWKPQTREEELKTWKEWYFGFTNYIASHDPEYEADLNGLDWEKEATHALMTSEQVARSQRLYGLLCSLLRGRPLMLIKACEKSKGGYEAIRILKNEMEPREKARTLALLRQLASWRFDEKTTMHEQLVRYEEALRTYETSSSKPFSEDVVLATR
eukprot:s8988_g3.t1